MDTETMIYIVTEYASKGDIFDHLVKTGKMSEPDACHVFAQILSAVKYCHTQGKFRFLYFTKKKVEISGGSIVEKWVELKGKSNKAFHHFLPNICHFRRFFKLAQHLRCALL